MSAYIQGSAGNAPRFNATGTSTTLQGVTGATVVGWAAYTGPVTTNEQAILNISTALNLAQTRANISFRHTIATYRASARRLDTDSVVIVDASSPVTDAPTHVCGVFEYDNQAAHIYINGVLEATTVVPSWTGPTSVANALGATIGGRPDGNANSSMEGLVGDVDVFGRALSAAEVANLFYTRGRANNFLALGNRFKFQGVPLDVVMFDSPDSVGELTAVPTGGPPQILGANYMATNRRRRRR